MNRILLPIILLVSVIGFTQNRKGQFHLQKPDAMHDLYVAFEPSDVLSAGTLTQTLVYQFPELESLQAEYQFTFEKGIAINNQKLSEMEADAKRFKGNASAVHVLRGIYKIHMANADNTELLALAEKLERLSAVRYCELVSKQPIVPPADIAPATPDFRPLQTYYEADPGVNMQYAHDMGLTGTGIRIRDVEYGMNKQHEEFVDVAAVQLGPDMTISSDATPAYVDHGTAVTGIMCADNGTYGITGLSYNAAEFLMFPEWQETGYNRVFAISQSIENSVAGDVIIFEMQTGGQTSTAYVPEEFNQVSWDLVKAATDSGITIVAAAGNGNQNLDATFYQNYMNRGDSGAIIVGGGTPNTSHNKISYSTYGSRVDVQGWASNVYATGYGDAAEIGGDYNQQYTIFSGTSSATPVVSGCVVALQQYYFEQTGSYMLPQDIRTLLKDTGIAQGSGGNVGPLPNMEAAITALQEQLGLKSEHEVVFSVYPNPAYETVNVHGIFSASAKAEIFTVTGQKVIESNLGSQNQIAIPGLASGMYILKITNGNAVTSKKIIVRQ
ncbi:S8 family peptidase [Flavobacterium silvaticum]|uniref:S8 family serine peptidase n=1 Tax=Flavobacterium silvaticum TaxID=1852020 RepID=A0A972FPD3_9FLAO|nr:S8 family peptidase [Flavobacterium silvaticum]NMH29403.1 S8 family serine peptidase [Flavobacterium silvaticum]